MSKEDEDENIDSTVINFDKLTDDEDEENTDFEDDEIKKDDEVL